jgi:hypothetical protein
MTQLTKSKEIDKEVAIISFRTFIKHVAMDEIRKIKQEGSEINLISLRSRINSRLLHEVNTTAQETLDELVLKIQEYMEKK